MCGILGYLSRSPLGDQRLLGAAQLTAHRGPDAVGVVHHGVAGLAFRRLAIIDLSADGCRPMANETGNVLVTEPTGGFAFASTLWAMDRPPGCHVVLRGYGA